MNRKEFSEAEAGNSKERETTEGEQVGWIDEMSSRGSEVQLRAPPETTGGIGYLDCKEQVLCCGGWWVEGGIVSNRDERRTKAHDLSAAQDLVWDRCRG